MASLELKKFDMKSISFKASEAKGPVIVLIGKRDTGKIVFSQRFTILPSRNSDWYCYIRNRRR